MLDAQGENTHELMSIKAAVDEMLEEAGDNMKFLSGIKRQVEVCANATSIDLIKTTIQKVGEKNHCLSID